MKHISELIKYRLEKSWNTYGDAELLVKENRKGSALNRMYYSCFYAVLAALLSIDKNAKTHKGVKSLFNEHFINTGIIPNELGKFYGKIFNQRMEQDYDDYAEVENIDLQSYLEQTKNFLKAIELVLK